DGGASHDAHYRAAAVVFFRPELLNRFDQIVPYRPLSREVVRTLARRGLEQALTREGLSRRGIQLEWEPAVIDALARLGFGPRCGARPLKRAIEQHVVGPLARLLAARTHAPPRIVRLRVLGGAILVEGNAPPPRGQIDNSREPFHPTQRRPGTRR